MREFKLLLVSLLVAAVVASCGDDDDAGRTVANPAMLGSFAVGHAAFTAVDETRDDRRLPVNVWYPVDGEDGQGFPPTAYPLGPGIDLESEVSLEGPPVSPQRHTLLVFSHGFGGIGTQSADLMETLASHGFIVVSPEHTGNTQSDMSDSFDQAAANRVPDVTFVIDTMFDRADDPSNEFYNRVDKGGVGVVGHSFGGMTAIGVAAGWAGADSDPRVKAIVPISAVIDSELQSDARSGPNAGFTRAQLSTITVPALLLGGSADVNVFIENNEIAFEQMAVSPRVYEVQIVGANHTHFANVCAIGNLLIDIGLTMDTWPGIGAEALLQPFADTCSPEAFPIAEAIRLQNHYVVAFFKRHLGDEGGYDRFLSDEYAASESAVELRSR